MPEYEHISEVDFSSAVAAVRRENFLFLREGRNVIKTGPLRLWDVRPGLGCSVQNEFYRRFGMKGPPFDAPSEGIMSYGFR